MQYEEVILEEKIVIGISARTRNSDPDMVAVIGGLWQRFFEEGICGNIENKKGAATICLYDAYESDVKGTYDATICAEVTQDDRVPEGCMVKRIPAGKYAKFAIKGPMQKAVAKFWKEFWKMPIARSYKADFEEYVDGTPEECEIHMYMSI